MPRDESLSGSGRVFTYSSDGTLPRTWRVRSPLTLVLLALALVGVGVVSSVRVNADSLPDYRVQVVLIGLVWGVTMVAITGLMVVLVVLAHRHLVRRTMSRLFPAGSTTEVELGEDALVIRRPTGEVALPYRAMVRVRANPLWIKVFCRGRARPELLPGRLLPAPALDLLRSRVGLAPATAAVPDHEPTRTMLVPTGWAAHLAAVHRGAMVRSAGFWVSMPAFLLLGGLLGLLISPWWWLLVPVLVLVRLLVADARTRKVLARALPDGSTASTYVLEDRFVSRNAGGTREILFADVSSASVHDDVVVLRLRSARGRFLIARTLLPPETLASLPQGLGRRPLTDA